MQIVCPAIDEKGSEISMQTKKVNIVTTTLPKVHGGRTKSLLQRTKLFNEQGIDVKLVTTNYHHNYNEIYTDYYEKSKVLENTTFCNIYDFYKNKYSENVTKIYWQVLLEKEIGCINNYIKVKRSKTKGSNGYVYYYSDGIPKASIFYENGKALRFALYEEFQFEPIKIFYINDYECVHLINTQNQHKQLLKKDFLTDDGQVYATKFFDQEKSTKKINLHTSEKVVFEFNSEKEFFTYYYSEIFNEEDIVITDARALDGSLLNTKVKRRIFQLHSSHLGNPLNNLSKAKGSFRGLLERNLTDHDKIITLTAKQRKDILRIYPKLDNNIEVISHSTKPRVIKHKKIGKRLGFVGRLDPNKNLEDVLHAFAIFRKDYPEYILDVYGDGKNKKNLEQLVKSLNIEDSVVFHGNVDDVDKAYQEMDMLLVTSLFEGFALNVLEAISNGTQVVTYDINYGPTDIIDENSGFIVKERTPEALAGAMIEAVKVPKEQANLIERSRKFSEEIFLKRWKKVLEG